MISQSNIAHPMACPQGKQDLQAADILHVNQAPSMGSYLNEFNSKQENVEYSISNVTDYLFTCFLSNYTSYSMLKREEHLFSLIFIGQVYHG
jgi:hypothetical protein